MTWYNPWQQWTEALADRLGEHGYPVFASEISAPPNSVLGDFAVPFFRLAKERSQSPAQLAQDAGQVLMALEAESSSPMVAGVQAAGPYLNIRLHAHGLTEAVNHILQIERDQSGAYGQHPERTKQAPILFEYANPNTHKEIHIGHLRNFVTGVAYHRLWRAAGIPVEAVQFVNDQGSNVAKVLWMLVRKEGMEPRSLTAADTQMILDHWPSGLKTGGALGELYVEAVQTLEQEERASGDVSFIQARLEAHDPLWERLWRETRDWCLRELADICEEMGIIFNRPTPYLESAFLDEASAVVKRLEEAGIATLSEGALVIHLEAENLGVCLVRKSDGNLLYLSKDLALAEQKYRDFPIIGSSIVLTDDRQSLHFKQLQAVLKKMQFPARYGHLGYGLLTLKEGAMSSRKGNIITYQWLRDELIQRAEASIRERHAQDAEWNQARIKETARAIAFGGMKFALLKQDATSVFLFDREQALAFEGMTGPYCQYAVVRLTSILEKANATLAGDIVRDIDWTAQERALVLALAALPATVERAAGVTNGEVDVKKTQPALLAQWCFTTAQAINAFYRDVPVLDAAPELRQTRLSLAKAATAALKNGLSFLTIDVPQAM